MPILPYFGRRKQVTQLQCWLSYNGHHLPADGHKAVLSWCIASASILWTLTGDNISVKQHLLPGDMDPASLPPNVPTKFIASPFFQELWRTGTTCQETRRTHPPSRHSKSCWGRGICLPNRPCERIFYLHQHVNIAHVHVPGWNVTGQHARWLSHMHTQCVIF